MKMNRRTFTKAAIIGGAGSFAGQPVGAGPAGQVRQQGGRSPAPEKEGGLTYYTANFAEVEQEVIKEFNKTFPKIKIAMVRAPGGQLITRIKTESGGRQAGRRRGQPFRPRPDARDPGPVPGLHAAQRRRLPARRAGLAEVLARRHAGLVDRLQHAAGEDGAKDLEGPPEPPNTRTSRSAKSSGRRAARPGRASCSSARCWVRTTGAKQAALGVTLYPSGAPCSDALVRGEVSVAPAALQHHLHQDHRGCAGRGDLRARGRADHPLCRRHHQDVEEPQCRQAVHELAPQQGRPGLPDHQARQHHLHEGAARPAQGLGSQNRQGLGAQTTSSSTSCAIPGSPTGTRSTATVQ